MRADTVGDRRAALSGRDGCWRDRWYLPRLMVVLVQFGLHPVTAGVGP